jgi:hypothetical protein
MRDVENDLNYCEVCNRVVLEGAEHDWQSHQSTAYSALELKAWKTAIRKTGEHH